MMKHGTPEDKAMFWNVVGTLFSLTKSEWEQLAAFCKEDRCTGAQSRLFADESLKLVDALPETCWATRAVFARLIRRADENESDNESAADYLPCV